MCGLYVRELEGSQWFPRFATLNKDGLTQQEFKQALEQLDAAQIFDKPDIVIQAYYQNLLARQSGNIGYEGAKLVLID